MLVLFKIAFRNLWQHKGKSLIIGIIMALGVYVLIVGNALMDTAEIALRRTFIDNYTGDVFISGIAEAPVSLFGVASSSGQEDTPIIPNYEDVRKKIEQDSEILGYSGQLTGFASLTIDEDSEERDKSIKETSTNETSTSDKDKKPADSQEEVSAQGMSGTLLFGIDPESYGKLFPSLKIIEGRYLEKGEEGLLINKKRLDDFNKAKKTSFKTGDSILLNGFGSDGFKIRSVPIVGVFEFNSGTEGLNLISYCDLNTVRALNGLTVGGEEEYVLSDTEKELLNLSNKDSLFEGDVSLIVDSSTLVNTSNEEIESEPYVKPIVDDGAYHFIVLKLKNPQVANAYINKLNNWFSEQGILAKAGDWKVAAGPSAWGIDIFRTLFYIAIFIVAIVAIIIIMNTLIVSIIERTGEIGTMRALGGRKNFVWRMFLTETFTLSFVFGVIGAVIAVGNIVIVNLLKIGLDNPFFEILFGGKVIQLNMNPFTVLSTIVLMVVVGFISHIYPVMVALKIQPVQAMQTE